MKRYMINDIRDVLAAYYQRIGDNMVEMTVSRAVFVQLSRDCVEMVTVVGCDPTNETDTIILDGTKIRPYR